MAPVLRIWIFPGQAKKQLEIVLIESIVGDDIKNTRTKNKNSNKQEPLFMGKTSRSFQPLLSNLA